MRIKYTDRINTLILYLIGGIEICIGVVTVLWCSIAQLTGRPKELNVMLFVLIAAFMSVLLGAGLIRRVRSAKYLLIFFSGYIILTKALIYLGLLTFNGSSLALIPIWAKDTVSVIYHCAVILALLSDKKCK